MKRSYYLLFLVVIGVVTFFLFSVLFTQIEKKGKGRVEISQGMGNTLPPRMGNNPPRASEGQGGRRNIVESSNLGKQQRKKSEKINKKKERNQFTITLNTFKSVGQLLADLGLKKSDIERIRMDKKRWEELRGKQLEFQEKYNAVHTAEGHFAVMEIERLMRKEKGLDPFKKRKKGEKYLIVRALQGDGIKNQNVFLPIKKYPNLQALGEARKSLIDRYKKIFLNLASK